METTIIQIDDVLVSSEIITEQFCCDYEKCKGVCCIIGDSGAPLEESECEALEQEYPHYSPLMTAQERSIVDQNGFFTVDQDGDLVTPLICGKEECVYTCFDEQEHCFCAVERAYFQGKTSFRKPISCWLYPIRVVRLSSGMLALNLHRWDICKDAFAKGKKEGIPVYQFLREPLIQFLGEDFYNALEEVAKTFTANS